MRLQALDPLLAGREAAPAAEAASAGTAAKAALPALPRPFAVALMLMTHEWFLLEIVHDVEQFILRDQMAQGENEVTVDDVQRELRRVLRGLRRRRPPGSPLGENIRRGRLGPRHLTALGVVAENEGLTVGELASRLGISLTAASQIASELSTAELVRREEDQDDRRRTLVRLHEQRSRHVRDWLASCARADRRGARAGLDPPDRAALVRGLAALADGFEAAAPPRRCPSDSRRAALSWSATSHRPKGDPWPRSGSRK